MSKSTLYGNISTVIEISAPMLSWQIGDVVRKLREQKGLTQGQLAELAGKHVSTVVRVEKGGESDRATIEAIAHALGLSVAQIYAKLPNQRGNVEPGTIDVSDYTPKDIPVVAEGEASPQGNLFWDDEGQLKSEIEDRISRPRDVKDPRAYGVKVRGDSMVPVFKPGMFLIVSPNTPVRDGDEAYVQLLTGERLVKTVHRSGEGWVLESANPAYPPRFVSASDVGAIHPVLYARRRR